MPANYFGSILFVLRRNFGSIFWIYENEENENEKNESDENEENENEENENE